VVLVSVGKASKPPQACGAKGMKACGKGMVCGASGVNARLNRNTKFNEEA
jgi:hypothetical protein